jgi:hypothetical protein
VESLEEVADEDSRLSSFRLEVSVAIGYQRRRAVLGGKLEGHIVTGVLLLVSSLIVLAIVLRIFQIF